MGSFLENQYSTKNPFELGPLAKKIKATPPAPAKKLSASKLRDATMEDMALLAMNSTQQAMNTYASGLMMDTQNWYAQMQSASMPMLMPDPPKEKRLSAEQLAVELSRRTPEGIESITDRAYQLKSMNRNDLKVS